ncbi:short-chain dehydrogenase [Thalassospira xiamenensis]|uniref:SDR family oxidoreductase n=1 Tax=Thalassospira xiamenensis TaxID=220697 RepID=UPI000DEDBECD|nr:SDR family oxidoreductase [Thalassospira xiamenensis]RCK34198.1 short-chain dehydrogenase [Thalassospira xiamenensis]
MQRTILITGASKGIGLALSKRLVNIGHRVIGVARKKTDDFPGELHALDMGDTTSAHALAELVQENQVDGIVNNVGLVGAAPLGEIDVATLDEVMRVNLHPALIVAQAALPYMKSQNWGRIINVSSLTVLGSVERTAYAAAKAALVSFTRGWALELAQTGITVNAVSPGPTETELFRENNPPGSPGESRYLAAVPMRRFGKPDEIAAVMAFLLSDNAAFITGQTIHVDGGASIGKASF